MLHAFVGKSPKWGCNKWGKWKYDVLGTSLWHASLKVSKTESCKVDLFLFAFPWK